MCLPGRRRNGHTVSVLMITENRVLMTVRTRVFPYDRAGGADGRKLSVSEITTALRLTASRGKGGATVADRPRVGSSLFVVITAKCVLMIVPTGTFLMIEPFRQVRPRRFVFSEVHSQSRRCRSDRHRTGGCEQRAMRLIRVGLVSGPAGNPAPRRCCSEQVATLAICHLGGGVWYPPPGGRHPRKGLEIAGHKRVPRRAGDAARGGAD